MDKFYLSTAIAYTSAVPHIGNVYEAILADAICRYQRLKGVDVYFQTGTDEHGIKIEDKAREAGVSPKEYVDKISGEIRRIYDMMGVSYDNFVRTTDQRHEQQVAKIFKKLYEQGDIYKDYYEGFYCKSCESFFTKTQLVDGKCPDCGGPVTLEKEEAYFFKMSKYQQRLIEHIEANPEFIQPESRKNEMLNNFLKEELKDLCVSRSTFDWGVKVPFDPKHVVYVWIDALSNYITGLGYDVDGEHGKRFKKYWPADVHLIGKDILRFHTIYWPIMLMALDLELPKQIFGHPWILFNKEKMSKSKGNLLFTDDLVRHYGVDAVRYFVLHEIPFAQDGNLTNELMIERTNTDLANTLGNLVNRTISMQKKYFPNGVKKIGIITTFDRELVDKCYETRYHIDKLMEEFKVSEALEEIMNLLRRANKYIDENEPWRLAKDDSKKLQLENVLYTLLETIRYAATFLLPFIPDTANKIFKQLNVKVGTIESLSSFGYVKQYSCGEQEILFQRIDADAMMRQLEEELKESEKGSIKVKEEIKVEPKKEDVKENAEEKSEDNNEEENEVEIEIRVVDKPKVERVYPEQKPEIRYEDFSKLDFVVGKILECKKHPNADKLLISQVDIGSEVRQIVSGIANRYAPEDIVGKKVIVLRNLKPANLRGERSEGMLICASNKETNELELIEIKGLEPGDLVS